MNATLRSIIKRILLLLVIVCGIGCAWLAASLWRECARCSRPEAPVSLTRLNGERVYLAVVDYRVALGRFPDSLDELTKPAGHLPPLLEKEHLADSRGEAFGYEHDGEEFVIWSAGRDGKPVTAGGFVMGSRPAYVESWKARHAPPVGGETDGSAD